MNNVIVSKFDDKFNVAFITVVDLYYFCEISLSFTKIIC